MSSVSNRALITAFLWLLAGGLLIGHVAQGGEVGGKAVDDGGEPPPIIPERDRYLVPTIHTRDVGRRAVLEGWLDLQDPGCPKVIRSLDDPGIIAIWPHGTYADKDGDAYGLFAKDGTLLAMDGDQLTLSGGSDTGIDAGCALTVDQVFVVESDIQSTAR